MQRSNRLTTIIRLVKLALLTCFRAYIKRLMRAILVLLFIWPFYGYKKTILFNIVSNAGQQ